MPAYILKRLLFILPTLFGIMVLNFIIIQAAPGGPVEQTIAKIKGIGGDATERISGSSSEMVTKSVASGTAKYRGAQGLDPQIIKQIEKMYGFDKPMSTRFWDMIRRYVRFDFGDSFFRDAPVLQLVKEKLPVSISLGLWTTLLTYFISIPLGIAKAVRDGTRFDSVTSAMIITGYAIPGFLFGILLIILFAGGSFWQLFPLRGLTSDNWSSLSLWGKVTDYLWHIVLPITAMVISSFATLTMLVKNSFLEEIRKQYVLTAYAKGCSPRRVLYGHVFRNAMLVVISGFPAAFIGVLFTSSLLIEVIFSLDGLGLLGFESAINRDYPVVFATLFIFTLIGLLTRLLGDITYVLVDPRIDFARRDL